MLVGCYYTFRARNILSVYYKEPKGTFFAVYSMAFVLLAAIALNAISFSSPNAFLLIASIAAYYSIIITIATIFLSTYVKELFCPPSELEENDNIKMTEIESSPH
eukprot:TRINITY_DN3143_c0_g3_i2.p1 TRINITY_DN3143_c0_g3~~TRINITY_DN3143_c0_g3_i2.p1  ORF type:complete len:105 (+),score=12.36 TRINITY_DN3143_c0_g3_i2:481-795(+)